jgi:ribonuclease HI
MGAVVDASAAGLCGIDGQAGNKMADDLERCPMRHSPSLELASVIGKLAAAAQALLAAPLYYRRLQVIQREIMKQGDNPGYDSKMVVQGRVADELDWWKTNLRAIKPAPIAHPRVAMTIFTDSSLEGWGAHESGISIQGRWSLKLRKEHINYLELLAIKHAIFSFAKELRGKTIQVYCDNSTAVAVMQKLGSNRSQRLNQLALEIWDWAISRNLFIVVFHIAGKSNDLADKASRVFLDRNSWQLYKPYFQDLEKQWGPHDIDLFADFSNYQVEKYVSWKPDPGSSFVDAFAQDWSQWSNAYAFPPFGLIARVLQIIRTQAVTVTLVFPAWPTQPWFSVLQEMLQSEILELPYNQQLLSNAQGEVHPMLAHSTLRLCACRVGYIKEINGHSSNQEGGGVV